ncbi:hypothetical protein BJF92_20995 [Rhizobium rhizosphaerae]|uniref:Uncharacterized protein n=1 Tax=Xaviernesmea rhizosphaerae TaxID=1672749 RepID=A0A1Q9ANJ8_9HYPH|nr:hypothetical protein BJF92_20995 [Xaviernesmea rhizosphaerae]
MLLQMLGTSPSLTKRGLCASPKTLPTSRSDQADFVQARDRWSFGSRPDRTGEVKLTLIESLCGRRSRRAQWKADIAG